MSIMISRTSHRLAAAFWVALCVSPLAGVGPEPTIVPDLLASEPLRDNLYMTYSNPKSWSVELNSYLVTPHPHMELGPPDRNNHSWATMINDLKDAGIVYPIVTASGSSWSVPGREREVSILIDQDQYSLRLDRHLRQGSRGPEMVFRPQFSGWTQFVRVQIHADMVSVDTHFDQRRAERLGWPERWPEEAERFRTPLIDSLGSQNELRAAVLASNPDSVAIERLLETLDEERGGNALSPIHEAKFLAARLIEVFEVNQPPMIPTRNARFLRMLENGEESPAPFELRTRGNFDGFNVMNPDDAARNLGGSLHDRTTLLTSLYRAAGLPARTVIGLEYKLKGDPIYRSWTEFALYDPDLDLLLWVPVNLEDLTRTRIASGAYRSKWKNFGSGDLHTIVPIAFSFHPPDTNKTTRVPSLVGIRPASGTTAVPRFTEQFMNHTMEPMGPPKSP
ncbi:MAG: transglutaminase domain-containing protein [Phycisphaerales bacterium]|nr:transglutaminase domain-containing protein [Phycisphaerales bacterium]